MNLKVYFNKTVFKRKKEKPLKNSFTIKCVWIMEKKRPKAGRGEVKWVTDLFAGAGNEHIWQICSPGDKLIATINLSLKRTFLAN